MTTTTRTAPRFFNRLDAVSAVGRALHNGGMFVYAATRDDGAVVLTDDRRLAAIINGARGKVRPILTVDAMEMVQRALNTRAAD